MVHSIAGAISSQVHELQLIKMCNDGNRKFLLKGLLPTFKATLRPQIQND